MIRFLPIALLFLSSCASSPPSSPGAQGRFNATLVSSDTVQESGCISYLLEIASDVPILHELRVLCDSKTGKAIKAWWMTKGMFDIYLPQEGLVVEESHEKGKKAMLVFDRPSFRNADISPVRLMSMKWID